MIATHKQFMAAIMSVGLDAAFAEEIIDGLDLPQKMSPYKDAGTKQRQRAKRRRHKYLATKSFRRQVGRVLRRKEPFSRLMFHRSDVTSAKLRKMGYVSDDVGCSECLYHPDGTRQLKWYGYSR